MAVIFPTPDSVSPTETVFSSLEPGVATQATPGLADFSTQRVRDSLRYTLTVVGHGEAYDPVIYGDLEVDGPGADDLRVVNGLDRSADLGAGRPTLTLTSTCRPAVV